LGHATANPTVDLIHGTRSRLQWWFQISLLTILIAGLYYRIFAALVDQWINDSNYSYGFIVPLFCIWIAIKDKKHAWDLPATPNWWGLAIAAGALGILVLGVLGAESFLSRVSFLFLIAGLMIQFRGWRFFRELWFPWAVLFLAIPIPVIILNKIAFPLQFLASRLASSFLAIFGVPVLREGNVIYLPSLTLDVVEACSGLRSLLSLITLSVFYAYLFEKQNSRRFLLFCSSIPIAVVANGFRIMGSGMLGEYWGPDKAEGFFHLFSGWLIFVVSLFLLILVHKILLRFGSEAPARND
jgi:exosortase